ncbi:lactate racemase domain-containing protein [Caproicibacter sp. BJN0012]|uniref:lactate racemase domain-containing protein n=1 Tax=Caproicibacter sp. BJN0012 TaxID=3110227 RepID=UPI002E15F8C0|nr:lactate racemase domain-containing protein [Caproicibacter sp. BJN0012]
MSALTGMLEDYQIPKVARIRQHFDRTVLENPREHLLRQLSGAHIPVKRGDRIAITGGSRGIAEYRTVMKAVVDYLKSAGAVPFIVPAMGSHGGATAEGQKKMLCNLGISEETVGAPVLSSMETVEVSRTDLGLPVYIDKNAFEADGIVLLNRVKTHTSIREEYQSGLLKMMAIGLAKHKGAAMTHSLGPVNLGPNMVRVGKEALKHLKVVCGVALIENGYEQLADTYVLRKDQILEEEPKILKRAISMIPQLPLRSLDCLIVYELGKDVSGTGMDPAIIGRPINRRPNEGPEIEKIGVLRITPKSNGNASGCGLADFISERMRRQINEEATMINCLTGMHPSIARIPATMPTDKLVFQGCLKTCGKLSTDEVRLAIVQSTKALETIYLSKAAVEAVEDRSKIELCSDFTDVPFDDAGTLQLYGF